MLLKATPERLSAFSDGVFAVLITVLVLELRPPAAPTFKCTSGALANVAQLRPELFVHRHRLDKSPLPDALCERGNASLALVQLRSFIFYVAASILHGMDGSEQIITAAGRLLCNRLLPRKSDLHGFDLGTHRRRRSRGVQEAWQNTAPALDDYSGPIRGGCTCLPRCRRSWDLRSVCSALLSI